MTFGECFQREYETHGRCRNEMMHFLLPRKKILAKSSGAVDYYLTVGIAAPKIGNQAEGNAARGDGGKVTLAQGH